MSFKPGFIAPPWPHTPGDSVRADSLILSIEKKAHHGCGLHDEIYHHHVLSELTGVLANLCPSDAGIFGQVAARRGFHLDDNAIQASYLAYNETMTNIKEDDI